MATRTADPLGVVAERGLINTQLTALSNSIAAYTVGVTGDLQGLRDMQIKAAQISFRLNSLSSVDNNSGTALAGFGLENCSTA